MTPSLQHRLADPAALLALYDRMLGSVDLPEVLRDVAEVVRDDFRAEGATVYLVATESRELVSAALLGTSVATIRVPVNPASLAGYCASSGRAFVVPDAYGDLSAIDPALHFDRSWDLATGFRTRDVLCAPAVFKGETVGVVQVINSRGEAFSEEDIPALAMVSRLIGYALYHARLYDDLATLKELGKEKAQFIRVLVHELKAPAAGAKMLLDAMRMKHADSPDVAALADRIGARMDQLLKLIGETLDLARVQSGQPLGEIGVVDLAGAVRAACTPYEEEARAKGLAMRVRVPDRPVPVRFDSQGLDLAISNLVSNAVKYTAEGRVEVTVDRRREWAVLAVRDTGIGIPEADCGQMFREFFRASNARRERIRGTGVGLAGAKRIVERFGGTLGLESRENEGSTFSVRLPLLLQ